MAFQNLAGERVDVAGQRLDVLAPAEAVYVSGRSGRRRHLAIFRLRIGYDWSFREIAEAIQVSPGHACRITRQVKTALEKIAHEIFPSVALSQKDDQ